jgi:hypothetical protein
MSIYSEIEFHVRTQPQKHTPIVSPPGKWLRTGTKQEAKTQYLNKEFTVRTNQYTEIGVKVTGIVIYGGVVLCFCLVEEKYQKLYGKEPLTFHAGRLVDLSNR